MKLSLVIVTALAALAAAQKGGKGSKGKGKGGKGGKGGMGGMGKGPRIDFACVQACVSDVGAKQNCGPLPPLPKFGGKGKGGSPGGAAPSASALFFPPPDTTPSAAAPTPPTPAGKGPRPSFSPSPEQAEAFGKLQAYGACICSKPQDALGADIGACLTAKNNCPKDAGTGDGAAGATSGGFDIAKFAPKAVSFLCGKIQNGSAPAAAIPPAILAML